MLQHIITKTQKIEITIIRDGNFYLYSRYIDGKANPVGKVISRDHALEIFENNKAGNVTRSVGRVDFTQDQQGRNWEWTVQVTLTVQPE